MSSKSKDNSNKEHTPKKRPSIQQLFITDNNGKSKEQVISEVNQITEFHKLNDFQKKALHDIGSYQEQTLLRAKIVFDKFDPKLITDKTIPCKELDTRMEGSEYVFVDFTNGTIQECDVLYSLVKNYGIKELVITTATEFEDFIKFCKGDFLNSENIKTLEGLKLANSRYENNRLNISALSVEMIKTISKLTDEGIITNIHRVYPPEIDFRKKVYSDIDMIDGGAYLTPYAGSINKAMADQILHIKSNHPILIFVPELFDGYSYEAKALGNFPYNLVPCAIATLTEQSSKKCTGICIKYKSGYGQNNGLIPFDSGDTGGGAGFEYAGLGMPLENIYNFEFNISNTIKSC